MRSGGFSPDAASTRTGQTALAVLPTPGAHPPPTRTPPSRRPRSEAEMPGPSAVASPRSRTTYPAPRGEEHIRQQGRDDSALGRAGIGVRDARLLHPTRLQPLAD